MASHEHGNMNIDVQEKTFEGFIRTVSYAAVAIILLLIFLALANG